MSRVAPPLIQKFNPALMDSTQQCTFLHQCLQNLFQRLFLNPPTFHAGPPNFTLSHFQNLQIDLFILIHTVLT